MFDALGLIAMGLGSPLTFISDVPLALVAHPVAAVIAYRQHHTDWVPLGAKYWLLATVGTTAIFAGHLTLSEHGLDAMAWTSLLGLGIAVTLSAPTAILYLAVRRVRLPFIDQAIERAVTAVATRVNALRERRAERIEAAPAPSKPARPRRMSGIPVTIKNAAGQDETIIVNPNAMTLPAKIHLWAGIVRHAAMAAAAAYVFYCMPSWLRPVAEAGAGIGVLGGGHLLHFIPHFFGL